MEKFWLLLFFATITIMARSQDYMVKHTGDTLRGEINLSGKSLLIKGGDGIIKALPAEDISYVHTGSHQGTVLRCTLMRYSDNIDVVNKWNYDGGNTSDTVLILKEVYFTPKMILYEVTDKEKAIYYFVMKPSDSLPVQMMVDYQMQKYKPTSQITMESYSTAMVQQKYYIDQLKVIMGDCDKITRELLETMDYRIYSFKKIIKRYNKCN